MSLVPFDSVSTNEISGYKGLKFQPSSSSSVRANTPRRSKLDQSTPNQDIGEVLKIALNTFNYKIPSRLTYDPFPDVKMTDWVAPYAQVAKEQGILKGFPEGMRPNELVSRAEALKILLTASKLPLESTSAKNFTDTSPGAWYMYYVRYAFENGIIAGYSDGSFRPSATITRAEIAKITVKIMDMAMGK